MKLTYAGQEQIPAGRDTVWAAVTNPEWIGQCLPDVISVTVQDPTHFQAIVGVGLGPVRGKFTFKFELQPQPEANRMAMKITGGGFGSAVDLTAGADIKETAPGATTLDWSGEAVMRGPVASVGGRVLDAQAQKLIAQTFANVRQRLS
jgi:carbon monoxide dehydrogenase subunit G